MDPNAVRMINLVDILAEDLPDVPAPPDDEIPTWSESEVRLYFSSGGETRPETRDPRLPGGTRDVPFGCGSCFPENTPHVSDASIDELITPRNYRRDAFRHGIPFRENGLFPPHDKLLTTLANDASLHAFQKNILAYDESESAVSGEQSENVSMRFEPAQSWANGDLAASHGLDLRCFFSEKVSKNSNAGFGHLVAAFRLGEGAAIGRYRHTSAHGGAVETVLDETTAELVKCARAPNCATTELTAKILKPVALHKTYKVECEIVSVTDFRARTKAVISDPENGTVYATCEATLADVGAIMRTKRKK